MANRKAQEQPLQQRKATLQPTTVNAKSRTVELIWSTGADVQRRDWMTGERFTERLSMSPQHIRLGRLNSGAPLLNSHDQFELQGVIGVVERAWIDKGEGRAVVRFSDRDDVEPIWRDVQSGVIRNVSVGYVVHKFEETRDGEERLAVRTAVDWEPNELSLVAVPADAGASVRNSQKLHHYTLERGRTMEREEFENEAQESPEETEARRQPSGADDPIIRAERRRAADIRRKARAAGLDERVADGLIDRGVSLQAATDEIIERMGDRMNANPQRSHHAVVISNGFDPIETMRLQAEALAARHGGPAPSQAARDFTSWSTVDVARECLERVGVRTRSMGADQIIRMALTTRASIGGLHTTSDFSALLQLTGDRTLREAYETYNGGIRVIARRTTAKDFRAKHSLQLAGTMQLEKVGEHGEFKYTTLKEGKESYSLSTFGRIFGVSRQALVNDDLGAFMDMNRRLGRAAAEHENIELAGLVTSNPEMGDGVVVFHADHGNLASSAGAISVSALGEARRAMRQQKDLDAVSVINVTPRFLVVPSSLETDAEKVLAEITAATVSGVNPFSGKLELVVDPRLDSHSENAWYLVADPAVIDGLEYAHLEGDGGPVLDMREGFDIDGVEWKVRLDFGAGIMDFRGLYKNPGV